MRILILSQWFEPEPALKGMVFARELARRGHHVEVLTGYPNYPDGNIYQGYRVKPCSTETLEGIAVHRLALYPSHDRSAMRRALNYASFAVSASLLGPALAGKPDVLYVYNLVTLGVASRLIRLLQGASVVYDVQDLWPDSVRDSGMLGQSSGLRLLGRWSDSVYRQADHVVSQSPGMQRELQSRGVAPEKTSCIYNWTNEQSTLNSGHDEAVAGRWGLSDTFNVMFAGTMGIMQGLDSVLAAARLLQHSQPTIRFVFVGGGVERYHLEQDAYKQRLENVVFLPRQPLEAMGPILAMADVLLVHLKDTPLFRITIPSKTQAYLAAGRPILMGLRGDAADLLKRSGGGVVCRPEDPASIAEGVLRLHNLPVGERRAMGLAGRRFYERELSLEVGVDRFEDCFQRVLARKRGHAR